MVRWKLLVPAWLLGAWSVGCGSDAKDGEGRATAGSGGVSSGAGGAIMTGGSSSGGHRAGTSGAGGASGFASSGAGASSSPVPADLGESCGFVGCTLSPCADESTVCSTGWCVHESEYLPSQDYCSVACDGPGAPCPADYRCVEDDGGGRFWCLKPMPLPPADFGAPCSATVLGNDCFLQDVTRECAPFTHDCDDECVTGPGHHTPVCSMHCSPTFDCPSGYDCRDTPRGSTFEMSCFPSYAPAAVLGQPCIPDPIYPSLCGAEPASCLMPERYGLCECLYDQRDPMMRDEYCSVPCTGTCPAGFECLPTALAPSSLGTGMYCFAVR